jgi:hypothetical protein
MTIYVGDKSDKLKRLSKILGMLGSAHPGEQSSAATKACELLREMGLTWDQVVGPAKLPVSTERPSGVRQEIQRALSSGGISKWQRSFLISISGKPYLTPKQRTVLNRIVAKVRQHRGQKP